MVNGIFLKVFGLWSDLCGAFGGGELGQAAAEQLLEVVNGLDADFQLARRVEVNLIARRFEIARAAAVYGQGFVGAAEQVPEFLMAAIKPAGVSAKQPLHPHDEIRLRRFDHQMKVIGQEAIGVHLPAGPFARLTQRLQEALSILRVGENCLTAIPTVHDVIHRPGVLDAQLASHGLTMQKSLLSVKAI